MALKKVRIYYLRFLTLFRRRNFDANSTSNQKCPLSNNSLTFYEVMVTFEPKFLGKQSRNCYLLLLRLAVFPVVIASHEVTRVRDCESPSKRPQY